MKKRLFCILLGALLSLSLPLSVFAIDGTITTEPIDLSPGVSLIEATAPEGAVAVGYNYAARTEVYYRVNGATLPFPNGYPYEDELLDGDTASPDVIIGSNDRQIVTNTQTMPFSAIAYIEIHYANGDSARGTAFMISPNVAMTAAHCLFNQGCSHDSANWAVSVEVYPGMSGYLEPYGVAYATEVVVGAPYYTESKAFGEDMTESGVIYCTCGETTLSSYYDWGFIRLDRNIGEQCGYFGYYYNNQTTGINLTLTGYPSNTEDWLQYTASGTSINSSSHAVANLDQTYVMFCNIDATGGQSGSPIYRYNGVNNNYLVYAVYNTGYAHTDENDGIVNQGCRITSQLYSFILAYTSL